MQVRAQGHGGFIAHQHQVQRPVLGQEEDHAGNRHRQHGGIGVPAGGSQAAHGPPAHGGNGVAAVVDHIESKAGSRRADGGQGRTGQNQLDRGCPSAHICQEQHTQGGRQRPQKGHNAHIVGPKGRSHTQQDCQGGTQGCAGGNAQHIGVCQRVLDDGLHHNAGHRQSRAHADGQHQPGQADKPDDIAEAAAAVKLRIANAQGLIEDHTVDILHGQIGRTHGHRPAQRENQRRNQQENGKDIDGFSVKNSVF